MAEYTLKSGIVIVADSVRQIEAIKEEAWLMSRPTPPYAIAVGRSALSGSRNVNAVNIRPPEHDGCTWYRRRVNDTITLELCLAITD